MSTKSSLAYGENFHLYHECLDYDNVYLRLTKTPFQVENDNVTVIIPIHIWETIRHYGEPDLSFCDLTDADILDKVTKEVNERVEEYKKAGDERERSILNILGSLVFGLASSPRHEQIELGVKYYKFERNRQQEIKKKVEQLKNKN